MLVRLKSALGRRGLLGAVLPGLLLLAGEVAGARATPGPAGISEAQLRAELPGTWRMELPKKIAPMMLAYIVVNKDGTFRIVAIARPGGMPARIEVAGTWQLKDRAVTVKLTQTEAPGLVGQSSNERVISGSADKFVFQDEDGTETMQRSRLPTALPPDLFGPLVILTDTRDLTTDAKLPMYPSEAVARDIRGWGIFRLHVDLRDGAVRRVEVERSMGTAILDKAAIDGFQAWLFKPPLLRALHQRRDPGNNSGEIVFRVPFGFLHSGPSKH